MRYLKFRLLNIAAFTLLLFSLYLNFIYKGGKEDFVPVITYSTDSTKVTDSTTRPITAIETSNSKDPEKFKQ